MNANCATSAKTVEMQMKIEHRYILEPYKGINTRYHCPECKKREKTFALYIDTETGNHISPIVGRCNRESNCGYHYTPKQYFQANNIFMDTYRVKLQKHTPAGTQPVRAISFIPTDLFKASLKGYTANHFVSYLIELFGYETAMQQVSRYFIGTSKHWHGATVFWQIDTQGNIRTGKIMLYSHLTGKRVKEPFNHIYWVHKAVENPNFELKQCFFGEHLLTDITKPIAIVESEKTAIIASVYLPEFVWLAVGSLTSLNAEKCLALKGRTVVLYPDLNGFEKWSYKAKELSHIASFSVSDLLERKASDAERKHGFDIADYLIKHNYKMFEPGTLPAANILHEAGISRKESSTAKSQTSLNGTNWDNEILELENYFLNYNLPIHEIWLNKWSLILNCTFFVKNHLTAVKANNGKQAFLPYLGRLFELKQVLPPA